MHLVLNRCCFWWNDPFVSHSTFYYCTSICMIFTPKNYNNYFNSRESLLILFSRKISFLVDDKTGGIMPSTKAQFKIVAQYTLLALSHRTHIGAHGIVHEFWGLCLVRMSTSQRGIFERQKTFSRKLWSATHEDMLPGSDNHVPVLK